MPHMLHKVAKRDPLRHFERSLHLVHRIEPADSFRFANRDRYAALASRRKVAFGGRMQGMQLQPVINKGACYFANRFLRAMWK